MKKYVVENEKYEVSGDTPKQVVEAIRAGSKFASHEDLATYMQGFAERYEQTTGKKIAHNNASNFFKSLLKLGYLQEVV